jgi:hypothetical protein
MVWRPPDQPWWIAWQLQLLQELKRQWHACWFSQLVIACHPSSWLDDKKATSKVCVTDLSSDLKVMTDLAAH